MSYKPIIVVSGEPNSVFLEIFFKSLKIHKYKSPIIIIASKKLLQAQMKKLSFFFEINIIDKNLDRFNQLNNKKINLINVNFTFKRVFEKISDKSNLYISECFDVGLKLIKKKNFQRWFCLNKINN